MTRPGKLVSLPSDAQGALAAQGLDLVDPQQGGVDSAGCGPGEGSIDVAAPQENCGRRLRSCRQIQRIRYNRPCGRCAALSNGACPLRAAPAAKG